MTPELACPVDSATVGGGGDFDWRLLVVATFERLLCLLKL